MKRFWLSWTARPTDGHFTLHSPWWISGYESVTGNSPHPLPPGISTKAFATICAAVQASSLNEAKQKILSCFDKKPTDLAWRFAGEKPANWNPWDVKNPRDQTRFPRAPWMKWPE